MGNVFEFRSVYAIPLYLHRTMGCLFEWESCDATCEAIACCLQQDLELDFYHTQCKWIGDFEMSFGGPLSTSMSELLLNTRMSLLTSFFYFGEIPFNIHSSAGAERCRLASH